MTLAERQFIAGSNHPVGRAAFENIPWKLFGSMAAARSQVTVRTPYLDNNIVALAFQIPETLRKSSRAALRLLEAKNQQLRRIPTDRRVEDREAGWRGRLRRVFSEASFKLDYVHNEGMPHWLSPLDPTLTAFASKFSALGRHKYLHYRSWFRRDFAKYVTDVITDPLVRRMPFWNPAFVANMAQDHVSGRRNYVLELNAVLTLEAVERLLFRPSSAPYSAEVARQMAEVRVRVSGQ
jgi:asparagine synthase (glutamine-hydrolysing)